MIELLTALAIWKITVMMQDYDGPLRLIRIFRENFNKIQPKQYKILNFDCFFCFSTVVAFPFALLLADGWLIVIYWFGLSGAALLIYNICERLEW